MSVSVFANLEPLDGSHASEFVRACGLVDQGHSHAGKVHALCGMDLDQKFLRHYSSPCGIQ